MAGSGRHAHPFAEGRSRQSVRGGRSLRRPPAMKIVLFGKNGQLGWELERSLPVLGDVFALDRAELDLCDLREVQRILSELKPDLVVNASAYTDVDRAEKEPDL